MKKTILTILLTIIFIFGGFYAYAKVIDFTKISIGDTISSKDIADTDFSKNKPEISQEKTTKTEEGLEYECDFKTIENYEIANSSNTEFINKDDYNICRGDGGTIDDCHAFIKNKIDNIKSSLMEKEIRNLDDLKLREKIKNNNYWSEFDIEKIK